MANFTGDGNFTYKPDQVFSQPQAGILTFISALNFFLSVTASLGNALILIALRKVSSIHPPTKLFFRCLAVSDLCVGIIVQPLHAADIIKYGGTFIRPSFSPLLLRALLVRLFL